MLSSHLVLGQTRTGDRIRVDVSSRLHAVRPLLRTDPPKAIRLLNNLSSQYPSDERIIMLLGETYQVMGETDSAAVMFERCLNIKPTHVQAGASLGVLYIEKGDEVKGDEIFDSMLERTEHGINTYRMIASTLSARSHYDLALWMYREGRRMNPSSHVLSLDIAYLEKSIGNFEAALSEYLDVVEQSPKHHGLAKDRILELFREPGVDSERLFAVLRERGDRSASHRGGILEILSFALFDQGLLENSLEVAMEADMDTSSGDNILFALAERASNEYQPKPIEHRSRYFETSFRALEAFLENHPSAPEMPRAKLMQVDLLVDVAAGRVTGQSPERLGSAIPQALETLEWIIETQAGSEHAEKAYVKKGDMVFGLLKDPKGALEVYRAGMKKARHYPRAFAERLGRTYLVLEDYERAEEHLGQLVRSRDEQLRETGIFYVGLLLSFTGDFEASRDTLVALAEGNPASQMTNDAIELAWIIEEGLEGDQKVLRLFINSLQAEIAADTLSLITHLQRIVSMTADTPLRSRALLKLGTTFQASGNSEAAIGSFNRFLEDYAGDSQVPEVHRRIGQVYEHGYGKLDLALEEYENVLLTYPHYMFLDDVREDVKRLRSKLEEQ
jgi:tetratricopeptide (TPR) repeat protein